MGGAAFHRLGAVAENAVSLDISYFTSEGKRVVGRILVDKLDSMEEVLLQVSWP